MKYIYFTILLLAVTISTYAQPAQINLTLVASTGFNSPVDIKHCSDDRIFVVEQQGTIRIMDKNGNIRPTAFLNITDRVNDSGNEQGLLGLAFSPNYKQDGYFYVNYINGSGNGSTRISRFSVSQTDSNLADASSEEILLTFTQPYTNHNGGGMLFGKDGYLYISQGDGGSGGDPDGYAQNKNTLLGKILRLDVSNDDTTYTVPATNPFTGQPNTRPEIWAYGLRNPWRISLDRLTGDLWMADVGQDAFEEIDFQPVSSPGGENYGWKCREGFVVCPNCNTTGCPASGFTDPVFSYAQSEFSSCSVTGGYVYRGAQYSNLFGKYVFADYCSGKFWTIKNLGNGQFDPDTLQDLSNFQYTSFGEDNNGELYVSYRGSGSGGRIYRVTDASDCNPVAFISFEDTISSCGSSTIKALYGDTLQYQWYNSNGLINGADTYEISVQTEGWYKVQVSKQQQGCSTMSDSVYVRINEPTQLMPAPGQATFCRNDAPASIQSYIMPAGGTFSGDNVVNNLFDPANADSVSNVLYTYTNQAGCVSTFNLSVRVNDAAVLTNVVVDSILCRSQPAVDLDGFVTPAGGAYSGSFVNNNQFDPANAPFGDNDVYYEYTTQQGCSSYDTFNIRVEECVGIDKISSGLSISVYPNPNNGVFNLNVSAVQSQNATVSITDAVGRVVFSKQLSVGENQSVAMPQLSKGVYTINVKGEKSHAVSRIIVE